MSKISDQAGVNRNIILRGHYALDYGVAGNLRVSLKVYRVVARYWRRIAVQPASQAGRRLHLGRLQPNQRTDTVAQTLNCASLYGKAAGAKRGVNQLPEEREGKVKPARHVLMGTLGAGDHLR